MVWCDVTKNLIFEMMGFVQVFGELIVKKCPFAKNEEPQGQQQDSSKPFWENESILTPDCTFECMLQMMTFNLDFR